MTCEQFFEVKYLGGVDEWYAKHDHRIVPRLLPSGQQHSATPDNIVSTHTEEKSRQTAENILKQTLESTKTNEKPKKAKTSRQLTLTESAKAIPLPKPSPNRVLEQKVSGPKTSKKPSVDSALDREAKWWFENVNKTVLLELTEVAKCSKQSLLRYAEKQVVGFRNFYYVLNLPGGGAVGNPRICRKIIQRKLPLPPLLDRKRHSTEAQCEAHLKKTFEHVWFVTVYAKPQDVNSQEEDTFEDELVKFGDLVAVNNTQDVRSMMTNMVQLLTQDKPDLCRFLVSSLDRVFRTIP